MYKVFFFAILLSSMNAMAQDSVQANGKYYQLVNDTLLYEIGTGGNVSLKVVLPFGAYPAHWTGGDQLISDGSNLYVLQEFGIAEGFYFHKIDSAFNLFRLDDSFCYGYLCREGQLITVEDKEYYLGHTDKHGYEIYRFDDGLKLVYDLNRGAGNAFNDNYQRYQNFPSESIDQKNLVVYAYSDQYGDELFWYTNDHQVLIYDHSPGLESSDILKFKVDSSKVEVQYTEDGKDYWQIVPRSEFKPIQREENPERWIRWIAGDTRPTNFTGNAALMGSARLRNLHVISGRFQQAARVQYFYHGTADSIPGAWDIEFVAAYDDDGNLKWHYPYQARYNLYPTLTAAGDEHVILLLPHMDSSVFGSQKLEQPGRGIRIVKIHSSGNVVQDKLLPVSRNFDVNAVKATGSEVLVALQFFQFHLSIDTLSVHSRYSPEDAILKLDQNLNPVFLQTLPQVDSLHRSETRAIEIDEPNNSYYVARAQGGRQTFSTCNYSDWHFNITAHDLKTGKRKWKSTWGGPDLNYVQDITLSSNSFLHIGGQYRDRLSQGENTLKANSHCTFNGFISLMDKQNGQVRRIFNIGEEAYELYDIDYHNGALVVLGRYEPDETYYKNRYLSLRFYDIFGKLIAEEKWLQYEAEYEHYSFNISDNSVYIVGKLNFGGLGTYPFTNESKQHLFVAKAPLNREFLDWAEQRTESPEIPVSLFPNPVNRSFFQLLKHGDGPWPSETIEIFNLAGQKILRQELSVTSDMEFISTRGLDAGQYVLRFQGSEVALKLVIL